MKKLYLVLAFLVVGMGLMSLLPRLNLQAHKGVVKGEYHDGDIIFQSLDSRQSMAIHLVTHSPYSHCGILFKRDGEWWVYEAIQPVSRCRLEKWISRGKEERYVVKRLKDERLISGMADSLFALAASYDGKDYDAWFGWDDERIYCSELVWKVYQRGTGLRLGKLQTLGSLDLSAPQVQEILYERYGDKVPLKDSLITPVAIFKSPLLKTVFANGEWIN